MDATEQSGLSFASIYSPPTNLATSGDDTRIFSALGSRIRMQILNALTTKAKTVSDLSTELRLHRITLRYHLAFLLSQGLIEEVRPLRSKKVGRPAILYRASKHRPVPSFPQRRFEIIGQLALSALVETIGEERASAHLRAKGREVGLSMMSELADRARIEKWTPETFERFVLNGLLKDFGVASEVLSRESGGVIYRSFGCPFLELAERMPELVCNSLDRGFHEGMDEAMGGARTERLACMGHGDPYCQYRLIWKAKRGRESPRESKDSPKRKTARSEDD